MGAGGGLLLGGKTNIYIYIYVFYAPGAFGSMETVLAEAVLANIGVCSWFCTEGLRNSISVCSCTAAESAGGLFEAANQSRLVMCHATGAVHGGMRGRVHQHHRRWQISEIGPKRDAIHHHLLEAISETANVLELRQMFLHTTRSGWWWCIKPLFRIGAVASTRPSDWGDPS